MSIGARMLLSLCAAALLLSSCGSKGTRVPGNGPAPQPAAKEELTTQWPLSEEAARSLQKEEARRLRLPRFSRIRLDDSVTFEFALVPCGTFPMGHVPVPPHMHCSSNPPHLVKLSRSFLVGRYELTWRQFLALVKPPELPLADQDTVRNVLAKHRLEYPARIDWTLADLFCAELSRACGVQARLITEAEWEYACRAGTTGLYGDSDSIDPTKANVASGMTADGKKIPSQKSLWHVSVGQYLPNWWGIHDMMGNVNEWCLDAYSDKVDISKLPAVDPVAANPGSLFRVFRGGDSNSAQTVFYRQGDATTATGRGVRVVIEIDDAIREKLVDAEAGGNALPPSAAPDRRDQSPSP